MKALLSISIVALLAALLVGYGASAMAQGTAAAEGALPRTFDRLQSVATAVGVK